MALRRLIVMVSRGRVQRGGDGRGGAQSLSGQLLHHRLHHLLTTPNLMRAHAHASRAGSPSFGQPARGKHPRTVKITVPLAP
jgi:hypothetical protein